MAEIIQGTFCDPPIVIARLGGSTTPVVAYSWQPSPDPRSEGDTVITADWSLDVLPDARSVLSSQTLSGYGMASSSARSVHLSRFGPGSARRGARPRRGGMCR